MGCKDALHPACQKTNLASQSTTWYEMWSQKHTVDKSRLFRPSTIAKSHDCYFEEEVDFV